MENKKGVWWRFVVGIIVFLLIVSYSITVVSWALETFSFFISEFFSYIIVLFGISVVTGIAFYVLSVIIPYRRRTVGMIMFIYCAIMFSIYAILFFVGQNPLSAVSFLIGILAALIGWNICKAKDMHELE